MRFDFTNTKKWAKEGTSYRLINPDPETDKHFAFGQFEKSLDDNSTDKLVIRGMANAKVIDRMDEVLDPQGIDINSYIKNPVLLFGHDYNFPIGNVDELESQADGVHFVATVGRPEKGPLTEKQKEVRSLIRQGILKTVSVGFIPKKIKQAKRDAEGNITDPTIIEQWELLELSVVSVPANQDSIFEQVDIRQNECTNDKLITNIKTQESRLLNDKIKIEDPFKNALVISLHFDKTLFTKDQSIKQCLQVGYDFNFVREDEKTFKFSKDEVPSSDNVDYVLLEKGVKAVTLKKDHDNEITVKSEEQVVEMLSSMMTLMQSMADAAKSNQDMLQEILTVVKPSAEETEEAAIEEAEEETEEEMKKSDSSEERFASIENNISKLTEVVGALLEKLS